MNPNTICIPAGTLAANSNDDAAAREREAQQRELARKLVHGEEVVVTPGGGVEDPNRNPSQTAIKAPEGKLA